MVCVDGPDYGAPVGAGSLRSATVMLLAVSQALVGYLRSTVPPPTRAVEPEGWVRVANPSSMSAEEVPNHLLLSLYEIEPNAFLRNARPEPSGGAWAPAPLPLSLHYMVSYPKGSPEDGQRALGGVLQAFHTQSVLDPRDYLPAAAPPPADDELPRRLRVALETPDTQKIGHIWSAFGQGVQLALFYRVDVALVPAFHGEPSLAVGDARPPRPRPLVPGGAE